MGVMGISFHLRQGGRAIFKELGHPQLTFFCTRSALYCISFVLCKGAQGPATSPEVSTSGFGWKSFADRGVLALGFPRRLDEMKTGPL